MLRKILMAVVLFAGVCVNASAEGYYGLSFSRVDLDGVEPSALDVKIGAQINDFFGIEGRLGVPLAEDSVDFFGTEVDIETDYIGALARFGSFGGDAAVYALVGMLDVTIEASAGGGSADDSFSDPVYGVGAEFGGDSGFALEYLVGSGDLEDVSWLNIGYHGSF